MPALKKSIRSYSIKRRWIGSNSLDRIHQNRRRRLLSMAFRLAIFARGRSRARLLVICIILKRQVPTKCRKRRSVAQFFLCGRTTHISQSVMPFLFLKCRAHGKIVWSLLLSQLLSVSSFSHIDGTVGDAISYWIFIYNCFRIRELADVSGRIGLSKKLTFRKHPICLYSSPYLEIWHINRNFISSVNSVLAWQSRYSCPRIAKFYS